jgi:hypothetical protein
MNRVKARDRCGSRLVGGLFRLVGIPIANPMSTIGSSPSISLRHIVPGDVESGIRDFFRDLINHRDVLWDMPGHG